MKPYMSPCINSSDENFDQPLWSHLEDTNEYRKESEEDQVQHKENKSPGKMSQNTMKPYMSPCINSSDENFDQPLWSHLEDTNEYRKKSEEDQVQHKENKSSGKMSQNTMKPYMSPCINSSDENFDPTLWSHVEDTNEYRKESEDDPSPAQRKQKLR